MVYVFFLMICLFIHFSKHLHGTGKGEPIECSLILSEKARVLEMCQKLEQAEFYLKLPLVWISVLPMLPSELTYS